MSQLADCSRYPNRVAGRVSPPGSHTTVHAVRVRRFQAVRDGRSSHCFSATMIAAQILRQSASSRRVKTTDGRVLPARFSPSRVVSPSGVAGSLPSVLRPVLTPAAARQPFLASAPTVADGLGLQVSLSKDVNSRCTTGPFMLRSRTRGCAVWCQLARSVNLVRSFCSSAHQL